MMVQPDYEDMLKSLNRNNVRYCIVGSFALAFHATPRYTKDLDILVAPTLENGGRIVAALEFFGFGELGLAPADFAAAGNIIQLGYEPVRIDLITSLPGLTFDVIWRDRVEGVYGDTPTQFISRAHLIEAKRGAGRPQDLLDVAALLDHDSNGDSGGAQ